ncbi:MAG: hypothetical protein IJV00_06260 [Clostridia bacterium]|nr:hypothetical protein [Clostridia bacterium]
MKKNFWFWFSRCSVIFAVFIAYIGLILLLKSLGGALWGLIPLVFMPLYVLIVSFVSGMKLFKTTRSAFFCVLCPLLALIAAGLVHFIADKAVNGFEISLSSAAFDALALIVCAASSVAAVKFYKFKENRSKRRRRFDD